MRAPLPWARVRRCLLPDDRPAAEGGVAGATARLPCPWPGLRCCEPDVRPGEIGRTRAAASSGPLLLDQGVAGPSGADQGRQLQWHWPAVKQGREKGHAFRPGGCGRQPMQRMQAAHRGRSPYGQPRRGGWRRDRGDSGWEGLVVNGERDRTRRDRVSTNASTLSLVSLCSCYAVAISVATPLPCSEASFRAAALPSAAAAERCPVAAILAFGPRSGVAAIGGDHLVQLAIRCTGARPFWAQRCSNSRAKRLPPQAPLRQWRFDLDRLIAPLARA